MLTSLIIQLSPFKMYFFAALFFWASWMATKKFLLLAILGLSVGETSWDTLHGQMETISSNPYVVRAAFAAGFTAHDGSVLFPLIGNALLALAMVSLVQAIKTYARAKRAEMQIKVRIHEIQGKSRHKHQDYNEY